MRDLSRSLRTAPETLGLPLAAFLSAQLVIAAAAWMSSVDPFRAAS